MPKLTVKDLLRLKGVRQLTDVYVTTISEAQACNAAGIDIITASMPSSKVDLIAAAAPNSFFVNAIGYGTVTTIPQALELGFAFLKGGADAVYCSMSAEYIAAMTREGIPCIGHVGLVPYKAGWYGGMKPFGKTLDEALLVYEQARRFQDAGAIAIEVELVPTEIATAITTRLDLLTISMGAGSGCDGQYLFATDILGTNTGHVPRHAKAYRDHASEYERLHNDSIAAFREYKADVDGGVFPAAQNIVPTPQGLTEAFLDAIGE